MPTTGGITGWLVGYKTFSSRLVLAPLVLAPLGDEVACFGEVVHNHLLPARRQRRDAVAVVVPDQLVDGVVKRAPRSRDSFIHTLALVSIAALTGIRK